MLSAHLIQGLNAVHPEEFIEQTVVTTPPLRQTPIREDFVPLRAVTTLNLDPTRKPMVRSHLNRYDIATQHRVLAKSVLTNSLDSLDTISVHSLDPNFNVLPLEASMNTALVPLASAKYTSELMISPISTASSNVSPLDSLESPIATPPLEYRDHDAASLHEQTITAQSTPKSYRAPHEEFTITKHSKITLDVDRSLTIDLQPLTSSAESLNASPKKFKSECHAAQIVKRDSTGSSSDSEVQTQLQTEAREVQETEQVAQIEFTQSEPPEQVSQEHVQDDRLSVSSENLEVSRTQQTETEEVVETSVSCCRSEYYNICIGTTIRRGIMV